MVKLKIENGKWKQLPKGSREGFYIDGILRDNLDGVYKLVTTKDFDGIFMVDGEERTGKSILAQQIGYYLTRGNLKLENICFSAKDFVRKVQNAKKFDCVIFDESGRGLRGGSRTKKTRMVLQALEECGQKNLFILICRPSFWETDKYVIQHRSRGCFHVYHRKGERGFFRFFTKKVLKVWVEKHDKFSYPHYPSFTGRFTKFCPVGYKSYRASKASSFRELDVLQEDRWSKKEIAWATLAEHLYQNLNWNRSAIADASGVHRKTEMRWRKDFKEEMHARKRG